MSVLETVKSLVKEITTLANSLSDAVLKGTKDDKIWSVMNTTEGDIPHETFNRRFDALFGEDCRDIGGRLWKPGKDPGNTQREQVKTGTRYRY